jgi:tellurite methyltransferase
MHRTIVGFHQDEAGDWVAELSCLHNQHVRNQPPFQERPWVLDESQRAAQIGAALNCPLCDRAELPEGLHLARTAGPWFSMESVPPLKVRVEAGGWPATDTPRECVTPSRWTDRSASRSNS